MKRNAEFKSIEKIGKKRNGQEAGYPSKSLIGNAFCYVCNKDFAARKSELIGHTNSSEHARNMETVQKHQPVPNFVQVARYPLLGA